MVITLVKIMLTQVHAKEIRVEARDALHFGIGQAGHGGACLHCLDDGGFQGVGIAVDAHACSGHLQAVFCNAHNVLQGVVDHFDNAEQDQHIQQLRQAAAGGVVAVILLQAGKLFVLALGVIAVLFLDFLHHGHKHALFCHGFLAVQGQREADHTDQQGEENDGNAVVADQAVDHSHDGSQNH